VIPRFRTAPVLAAALAAVFFTACVPLAAQSGDISARTASVTGFAIVYSADSGNTFALTPGFLLNPGDRIDTRGGGRVTINLSDGSLVVIDPQSVIQIKDFRQAESLRELFEITLGKVRVKINHYAGRPNPYRMNSPTASIAVRGTEFSIEVGASGETKVIVYEGAVQVTSLTDPNQSVLVEAGRGVMVDTGRDFHMLGADGNLIARAARDRDRRAGDVEPPPNLPPVSNPAPGAANGQPSHNDRETAATPRATASAYDSYVASLSDIVQMPFLFRFNAFAEPYLDSLENPAYATQFQSAQGRIFVLPTAGGGPDLNDNRATLDSDGMIPGTYSITPQVSMFSPVGHSNLYAGASLSQSRLGDSSVVSPPDEYSAAAGPTRQSSGSSNSNFYSGSLLGAARFGPSSIGVEVEYLRGTGSLASTNTDLSGQASVEQIAAASRISQTRITAGYSYDLGRDTRIGIFYRYGFISGDDHDLSHTLNALPVGLNATSTAGHSSEIGFRLRGNLRPRLMCGITGALLGVGLGDNLVRTNVANSTERDRAQRASLGIGLGYALNSRTMLTFDTSGGTSRVSANRTEIATGNPLQNGTSNGRFFSLHVAVQRDLARHFFVSASFLNIWDDQDQNVNLFPDQSGATALVQDAFFPIASSSNRIPLHFSDFGIGWRNNSGFFIQYLFTTDYGAAVSSHTLMLRYTFRLHKPGE
jgi:hypothetical protein